MGAEFDVNARPVVRLQDDQMTVVRSQPAYRCPYATSSGCHPMARASGKIGRHLFLYTVDGGSTLVPVAAVVLE